MKKLACITAFITYSLTSSTASYASVDLQQVDAFIQSVSSEHKLDPKWVRDIISQAQHQQSIIDAMNRPAEKVLQWHEYRNIFIQPERVAAGMEFWQQHAQTLNKVSEETGVPVQYILGIIGVETYYGRIMGKHQVLDALYTLAFDYPKRSKFFTKELKHFLLLAREQHVDPLTAKGSYAGAMGFGQFMPSSYRSYAVDFEQDEKIDLLNNPADAIASVANYLKAHGWKKGQPIVKATEKPNFNGQYNKLKPHTKLQNSDTDVTLLELQGAEAKEYWVGYHNFYVISRYNHSHMYVMAVHQLAESLMAAKGEQQL